MSSEVTNMSFDAGIHRSEQLDIPLKDFDLEEDKAQRSTPSHKSIKVPSPNERFMQKCMWLSRFMVSPGCYYIRCFYLYLR